MSDDKEVSLEKAESHARLPVPSSREMGQSGIATTSRFIEDTKKTNLTMDSRLATFDKMMEDDSVSNSVDITNLHTVAAIYGGGFKGKTKEGQVAADFLNYNIRNMSVGTWYKFCLDAVTDLKYGFSLTQPVLEKRKYGKYRGNNCLKKMSPRSQHSVYGWVWDDNFREVIGIVQKPMWKQKKVSGVAKNGLTKLTAHKMREGNYTYIPLEKLLHFNHGGTNNNPQGESPMFNCYDAWMEKKLIEHLETVGATKDLAGIVTLRVPSELVTASNDGDQEAQEEYRDIQMNVADLHAGKSTSMVLLSDRDDKGNLLYDVEIKGVDGGSKMYNTSDIIDQKRKSIYNVFGTGFLLLGQSNTGSNAASETGNTTHDYYVQRRVMAFIDVLNTQLAPRLLAANDIYLDWEDMPQYEGADHSEASLDEIGKFINRTASTNMLTEEALTKFYEILELPTEGISDMIKKNEDREMQSKAGESNGGTSGTGAGSQDAADSNSENAS